jgi:tripartite ATP-independent transporter DctM subunit
MTIFVGLWMFPALFLVLMTGFPVALSLMGVSLIFGVIRFGDVAIYQLLSRVEDVAGDYTLAAIPLFVFMGSMLERSGIAERLFEAVHLWTRRVPGGLAVGSVIMCVIFAAASGVTGATESVVGLLAIPAMLKYAYDKGLISGTICAGGALGVVIPPSIIVVVLGPVADVPVGDLFIGMIFPGLILAGLYILYILARCTIHPESGPRLPKSPEDPGFVRKLQITIQALIPPVFLVFTVLGSIILGWAAPTEAAGMGAGGAFLLTLWYRTFSLAVLKEAAVKTLMITCMIMLILLGGTMFSSVFVASGGLIGTERLLAAMDFGKWETFALVLGITFVMGFVLDLISIILIVIPIAIPVLTKFGFDPIWFSIVFMIMLQTGYLTPPFAPAIFFLKGIDPPGITLAHMYKGVVPFVILQLVGMGLVIAFPQIALWLPGKVLGGF